MNTYKKINKHIRNLPEESREKVLRYIEFMLSSQQDDDIRNSVEWHEFSLNQAMRGLEDDPLPDYKISDIKEFYRK